MLIHHSNMLSLIIILKFLIICNTEIIKIKDGHIRGTIVKTRQGRSISAYMGIPYATPPVGDLRFMPPVPIRPWVGVLDTSKIHQSCPQVQIYTEEKQYTGEENCLFINVYAPLDVHKKLPVMVYIHGGGYRTGCGNYDCYGPGVLLDNDVILVAFNYRLASLGFLSTDDDIVPGNNGLKDQNLALKWVKNNIANFGGDTSKITIFGQSAGAASVHLHMLSPKSKGLFNNAISESGTALSSWAFDRNQNSVYTKKLAEYLACPTETNLLMIDCLRTKNASELIEAEIMSSEWSIDPTVLFKPTIEKNVKDGFISQHPLAILQSGIFTKVPWIIGGNTEEGSLRATGIFSNRQLVQELNTNFSQIAPITLDIQNMYNNLNVVTNKIRKFYFGEEPITYRKLINVIDMYTDARFFNGMDESVRTYQNFSHSNIYFYLFGYHGTRSFSKVEGADPANFGVNHCDELFYLFPFLESYFPNTTLNQFDLKIMSIMTSFWTSFSTFSKPTVNDNFTSPWSPIRSKNLEYYFIGQNNHMSSKMVWKRTRFWRKLNKKFRKTFL